MTPEEIAQKSYEYINEFLYFVVRHHKSREKGLLLYCSGVNIVRFLPITKGRHRPMSNPAMRGLQLVNIEVRAMALSHGATPKALRGNECVGIAPTKDSWYTERLLIENAPESLPDEIITYGPINLLKKINKAILLGAKLPEELLNPDELQMFIENLCNEYGM
jgi:hypothetical protein